MTTAVVIPALDEEAAIGGVIESLPRAGIDEIVVCDNGSRDRTAAVARAAGATVVAAPRRGYGSACLAGLAYLRSRPVGPPDVVAFVDADGSDVPAELPFLLAPLAAGGADLVIGSRVLGRAEPGALTPVQRFGNRLASLLLAARWGATTTDLGPFRAIRWAALERLAMQDRDYGWTVEMQARALRLGLVIVEVPVTYRRRVGRSKISGTLRGVVGAGTKILWTIGREALRRSVC
ncbi:MAG: glycosyltransferase family 2 protein [Candidatus Eisenbacteria bacterium]